ncbi:MAG: hypothetical protein CO113_11980 [Elusimicrobia bacterium CG_4_9_14_3_um_filter_62_55]|nr:MAG: hypothetical protein COR54_00810 [Elusimicrobia bacterium CG22_combo_CG10-13_8_21_14_all_63_91]PJA16771.1 MAG: hypothetical protein COX66_06645 [Elusimicrobia bacterium CG_4_10_14_0_2_um_filter_63_34]PJB24824.1 MAG: hypothetical protein CO113_11980 [Elusimicrobia bacterium CG_4_9_14_3_um_filter_62_55]
MLRVFRFLFLSAIKILGRIFYRFDFEWVGTPPQRPFERIRLNILLNHTSLLEPVVLSLLPFSYLWKTAGEAAFPAADITMNRSVAGTLYAALAPHPISISRRRDHTWRKFLELASGGALIFMTPEGRMKRLNGLDKHGKLMTVRRGVAEVLREIDDGDMLVMHSGGLHHVLAPGWKFPRLFKEIRFRFELLPIVGYKRFLDANRSGFEERVIADLEERRDRHCFSPATREAVELQAA